MTTPSGPPDGHHDDATWAGNPAGGSPYDNWEPQQPYGQPAWDQNAPGYQPQSWQDPNAAYGQDPYQQPYQGQPNQGQPYQGQPYQGQPQGQPQGYQQPPAQFGGFPGQQYAGGPPPKKNNGLIIGLAAGAVALIVVVAIAVIAFSGGDKNKADTNPTPTPTVGTSTTPSTDRSSSGGSSSSAGPSTSGTVKDDTTPLAGSCDSSDVHSAIITLTVALDFVDPGATPSDYVESKIDACTPTALRDSLKPFYGFDFDIPYSANDQYNSDMTQWSNNIDDGKGGTVKFTMTKKSSGTGWYLTGVQRIS